jgi:exodeoxyribonuclease I
LPHLIQNSLNECFIVTSGATLITKQQKTFLFHDYETFGIDPARDRPSQFASIRTDANFNVCSEPVVVYCQMSPDYLPAPEACLITGITPQIANQNGLCEADFFRTIHQEFSQPGTCILGYNNIRFDDEFTRYGFYRNFFDPYAYSWQQGNSRWDLLDVARAFYALRPEGINWVYDDEGKPSFRLEKLSVANGITHDNAHDAMSDVYATIGLAKCLKQAQPRLFDYLAENRNKHKLKNLIDIINIKPLVHVSGMLSARQGCASWIAPMAWHPTNSNAVIVIDLAKDITPLLELNAETLLARLYTRRDDLGNALPVPVKLIHINKCPIIAPAASLSAERAQELGLDRDRCMQNLQIVRDNPQIREKLVALFNDEFVPAANQDPEHMLYQGFFSEADRATIDLIQQSSPEQLALTRYPFHDPRLHTLLFRYRARNYPHTLSQREQEQWQQFCSDSLNRQAEPYLLRLEELLGGKEQGSKGWNIIKSLALYLQGK